MIMDIVCQLSTSLIRLWYDGGKYSVNKSIRITRSLLPCFLENNLTQMYAIAWLGRDGGKYSVKCFMWPFKSRSPRIGGPRSIRTLGIVLYYLTSQEKSYSWILLISVFQEFRIWEGSWREGEYLFRNIVLCDK